MPENGIIRADAFSSGYKLASDHTGDAAAESEEQALEFCS